MGCAKIFDWVIQSTEHQRYATEHFPITAELVMTAQGNADFYALFEQLTEDEKAQFNGEQREWQKLHGIPWEAVGCPPERYVDEHTGMARLAGPSPVADRPYQADVAALQKALTDRGYRTGNTLGIWGEATCAAIYKFRREYLSNYSSKLDAVFFQSLGFPARTADKYAQQFAQACVEWYTSQVEPTRADVQGIQQALMNKGYNPGSTDGVFTEKTSRALKAFQHAKTGSSSDTISATTFNALGYDPDFATVLSSRYGSLPAEGGMVANEPQMVQTTSLVVPTGGTVDEEQLIVVEDAPESKFPVVPAILVGLGLIGAAVYLTGRKKP